MSRMKLQYIVTPRSAPEYRKYDICQGFITGMCQDMSCIRSCPQNHIASHCITLGDVHFSLGVNTGQRFCGFTRAKPLSPSLG